MRDSRLATTMVTADAGESQGPRSNITPANCTVRCARATPRTTGRPQGRRLCWSEAHAACSAASPFASIVVMMPVQPYASSSEMITPSRVERPRPPQLSGTWIARCAHTCVRVRCARECAWKQCRCDRIPTKRTQKQHSWQHGGQVN